MKRDDFGLKLIKNHLLN